MLTIGYIGNGKSTNRYHLPYVLARPETLRVKTIYRRNPAHDEWPAVPNVYYTSDLNELLDDPEIDLVCVCTSAGHYEMSRQVLLHGKHCMTEKPFTQTRAEAEALYELAQERGLLIEPYQNRRYDSDFLTLCSVLESGKLGQVYEIESASDYYRPEVPNSVHTYSAEKSFLYSHACHLLDRMLSLYGTPEHVDSDVRQLLGPGRMNDYFDLDLHYSRMKVSLRASYFRVRPRPSFVAYGSNGMFVKVSPDRQELDLKRFYLPGQENFGLDRPEDYGTLIYQNGQEIVEEQVPTVAGDYGRAYDALHDAICRGTPQKVTREQVLTQIGILEGGCSRLR